MKTETRFIVLRAPDFGGRVVRRLPRIRPDEVVYRLALKVPEGWGAILGDLVAQLPEPPTGELAELVEQPP